MEVNEIVGVTEVEGREINKEQAPEVAEKLSYTQEELDKLLQATADKRVTSALQKAQGKWEAEYTAKLEAEKSEAEKLAKMSESEKAKAEIDKMRKDFESERSSFLREKLQLETVKQLSENGLPTAFADFIVKDTAEDTKASIDTFKQAWDLELQAQIEKHVEDRLKGTTPKKSNGSTAGGMSFKEFGKLPMNERAKIMNEQPDLFNQIMNNK